jgi:hypothetical protein
MRSMADMGSREPIPPGQDGPEGGPPPELWDITPMGGKFTPGDAAVALKVVEFQPGDGAKQVGILFRVEGTSGNSITMWRSKEMRQLAARMLNYADAADQVPGQGLVIPPKGLDLDGLGDIRGERPPG